jgi:hypothetical protein
MFTITTHNPNQPKADFYILAKGKNAGLSVMEPTANCFAVNTDANVLDGKYFYYLVLHLFNSGVFTKHVGGSVVPFITKKQIIYEIGKYIG